MPAAVRMGLGFRVWGLGFGVWGLGLGVSGFGISLAAFASQKRVPGTRVAPFLGVALE